MRIFDVFTEWKECCKAIDDFLDNHRLDPYTDEEIKDLSKPPERKVPGK